MEPAGDVEDGVDGPERVVEVDGADVGSRLGQLDDGEVGGVLLGVHVEVRGVGGGGAVGWVEGEVGEGGAVDGGDQDHQFHHADQRQPFRPGAGGGRQDRLYRQGR